MTTGCDKFIPSIQDVGENYRRVVKKREKKRVHRLRLLIWEEPFLLNERISYGSPPRGLP
jgi:hypothetical protein